MKFLSILFLISVLTVTLFTGCASSNFQKISPDLYQSPHRTEFVLVKHPSIKYFWNVIESDAFGNSRSRICEIRRDKIATWGFLHHKPQEQELDLVEPYLPQLQDQTPLTLAIYLKTLHQALKDHNFMQLESYNGNIAVNEFEQKEFKESKKSDDNFLPYYIPDTNISAKPDWYLILEVNEIGLSKVGVCAGGTGLSGILTNAITEDVYCAIFKGQLILADAQTSTILWKAAIYENKEIGCKLEDLVNTMKKNFPNALVQTVVNAAAKNAAELITNKNVRHLDKSIYKYRLKRDDIISYINLLYPSEQETTPETTATHQR
ncbi:hypothetical protein ACFL27_19585 [candidate division CSSED10-310 bacterium]|uniref:Lipoprotein n=1 Tax=candidate division CSSED10-310 bacterium TaxID=2855610 RepID=A0ABV6Z246_UNCC1